MSEAALPDDSDGFARMTYSPRDMFARSALLGLPAMLLLGVYALSFFAGFQQGLAKNPILHFASTLTGWRQLVFILWMGTAFVFATYLLAAALREGLMGLFVLRSRLSGRRHVVAYRPDASEFIDSLGRRWARGEHADGRVFLKIGGKTGFIIFPDCAARDARAPRLGAFMALVLSVVSFRRVKRSAFYVPVHDGFAGTDVLTAYAGSLRARAA